MSIYRCGECDEMKDNDYQPVFDGDKKREILVCGECWEEIYHTGLTFCQRCSNCREIGHNIRTCGKRKGRNKWLKDFFAQTYLIQ